MKLNDQNSDNIIFAKSFLRRRNTVQHKKMKAKVVLSGIILAAIISGILILSKTTQNPKENDVQSVSATGHVKAFYAHAVEKNTVKNPKDNVIFEKSGIIVVYKGIDEENICLTVTNRYGGNVIFENNQLAVNGVMIDSSISQEVNNGETAFFNIEWKTSLADIKPENVKNIVLSIACTDDSKLDICDTIKINLGNEEYKESIELPQTKIFDRDGIRAYYKKLEKTEGLYAAEAKIIVVNETNKIINFDVFEGKVNKKKAAYFASIMVYPGCISEGSIGIEGYQTKEIKTMQYSISVNDNEYNELIKSADSSEIIVK